MISTPTTFVIGAGASVPYGLPTAVQVKAQATALEPRHDIYQLLLQTGEVSIAEMNTFLDDLRQHRAPSIDAFLESRQERPAIMKVGRLVLATLLGQTIAKRRLRPMNDWLEYILERMRGGAATWQEFAEGNSEVRFVTFNFDSVIEDQLGEGISAIYRGANPHLDLEAVMARFPVIHVHGQLPPPPTGALASDAFDAYPASWRAWPKEAAAQINVVLDAIDDQTLQQAREAVHRADIVCFLGFAYATENLTRLNIPDGLVGRTPHLYGSAFGLRDGEQAWVRGRIARHNHLHAITLGPQVSACLDILRDFHVFRD